MTDSVVDSVLTSVVPTPGEISVSGFVLEAGDPPDASAFEPAFSCDSKHPHHYTHDGSTGCPCECLGEFGCPIDRYFIQRGNLTLVFYAADYKQLQAIVDELRGRFPGLNTRRLVRSPTGGASGDSASVDYEKFTVRQLEVLQAAYDMGYFEHPRGINATEAAAELDISQSASPEYLAAILAKLLDGVLGEG